VDGLLDIYGRAVRDRVRSFRPVGVTLSGGLDSGSTSALAARQLGKDGKRLMAFTSVPIHDVSKSTSSRRFGDELSLAKATAEFLGNIDLFEIPARDISPLNGIRRGLEIMAEPGHAASNFFWIFSLYKETQKQGVGVILTGQGGNASVSWNGAQNIISLLRAHDWKNVFLPLIPESVLRAYRLNFRLGAMDWSNSAIKSDFAARLNLARMYTFATGSVDTPESWAPPLKQRFSILLPGRSFIGALHAEMGAAYGLDVRDATLDKRVLEYCISVPDREFRGPQQMDRWLIRSAMQGLLPDEVRLNRQRGLQSADLGWRLLDCEADVEQALQELKDSNLVNEYLSLERIQNVWLELKKEVNRETTRKSTTILTRGLMAGLYLAALEKGLNL
jgi:asparagine synthase (glutamine-hydrolysing)